MKSLGAMIERIKIEIKDTTNEIFEHAGMPGYLREEIIMDVLADVRELKCREMALEYEKRLQDFLMTMEEKKDKGVCGSGASED